MTKRSRTILFLILTLLFLFTAPTVVLFSQGFRFDWETKRVTQVGAFFFDVSPSRARISVDGTPIGETARFIGSSLTKNFLPKTYTVQISKEGYHTWEKNLEIKARQVTEAKNITLFPQNVSFRVLKENIVDYWKASNQNEAIIQMSFEDEWTLSLWDFERDLAYEFYRGSKTNRDSARIEWAPDASKIIVEITSDRNTQITIHILNRTLLGAETIEPGDINMIDLDFLGQNIERISFSPDSSDQLILIKQGRNSPILYLADYVQQELLDPIAQNVMEFTTRDQTLIWLDNTGTIWQKDISSSLPAEALNSIPLSIQPNGTHEIFFIDNTVYLKQEKNLYQFDSQVQNFQIISIAAQEVILSPDRKKFALTNGSEISIYYIANETEQPQHEAGDQIFLTRFSKKVDNLIWINDYYIGFTLGETIKIAEIDNRDRINIPDIAQFSKLNGDNSKVTFFWDSSKHLLYAHAEKSIQVSTKLIQ